MHIPLIYTAAYHSTRLFPRRWVATSIQWTSPNFERDAFISSGLHVDQGIVGYVLLVQKGAYTVVLLLSLNNWLGYCVWSRARKLHLEIYFKPDTLIFIPKSFLSNNVYTWLCRSRVKILFTSLFFILPRSGCSAQNSVKQNLYQINLILRAPNDPTEWKTSKYL